MIPQANVDYLWNTVVTPRLGAAYEWGTFDCSMAVSQELEAVLYGPQMTYARQFTTMSFAGVTPGQHGPFAGINSTTDLICIAAPTDAPPDAAMIIAIIQDPNPEDAHMICRVPGNPTGVDIEMGGESNDYHTSQSDPTCASVYDTAEFNQWLYLPGPIDPGDPMTLFGTDVANVNFGGATSPDLTAVAAFVNALPGEGFSWLEFKATQGSDFVDPCWETAYQTATGINLPIVAYHYIDESDPASQAQNAASVPGAQQVGWMLDWEDGGGDGANLQAVYNAFTAAKLNVVLIYAPSWYWSGTGQTPDLSGYPAIASSDYPDTAADFAWNLYNDAGGDSGAGWNPYGGATPSIWQFTDNATIASIQADADAFIGTQAQLLALLGATPAPTPAPATGPVYATGTKPADEPTQVSQLYDQLLIRWPFLGGNTVAEALGVIGAALKVQGYSDPLQS